MPETCNNCNGTGKCWICDGSGSFGGSPCNVCDAKGRCPTCGGSGIR